MQRRLRESSHPSGIWAGNGGISLWRTREGLRQSACEPGRGWQPPAWRRPPRRAAGARGAARVAASGWTRARASGPRTATDPATRWCRTPPCAPCAPAWPPSARSAETWAPACGPARWCAPVSPAFQGRPPGRFAMPRALYCDSPSIVSANKRRHTTRASTALLVFHLHQCFSRRRLAPTLRSS